MWPVTVTRRRVRSRPKRSLDDWRKSGMRRIATAGRMIATLSGDVTIGQLGSFRIALQSRPKRTIYPGGLLIEQGGIAARHFFRRNRFKMTAEQPYVAERITHLAGALAVELIL